MGEDLCKPCENYLKGEEKNLSQKNFMNDLDNDDITNSSKLLLNSIKKKPTKKLLKKSNSNNSNDNNNTNNNNNNDNNNNNNDNNININNNNNDNNINNNNNDNINNDNNKSENILNIIKENNNLNENIRHERNKSSNLSEKIKIFEDSLQKKKETFKNHQKISKNKKNDFENILKISYINSKYIYNKICEEILNDIIQNNLNILIKNNNKKEIDINKENLISKSHNTSVTDLINIFENKSNNVSFFTQTSNISISYIKMDSNFITQNSIITEHKDRVYNIIQLKDGRIVSCSQDNYINFYNKNNFILELRLKEPSSVNYLMQNEFDETIFICSNVIKLIKIKENNEIDIIQNIYDHVDIVNKIIIFDEKSVFSCSDDKTIKFFIKNNNNKYSNKFTLKGHNQKINSIFKINEKFIVSTSKKEKKIIFWDVLNKNIFKEFNDILCSNGSNIISTFNNNNYIFIAGKFFYIFNNNNEFDLINKIENKTMIHTLFKFNENIFIMGDTKGNLFKYEIDNDFNNNNDENNNNHNQINLIGFIKNAHKDYIEAIICIDNKYLLTASDDKQIIIWNINN